MRLASWHAIVRLLGPAALLLLAAGPAGGQEQPYEEDKVKAAFVVRFADFVQWPPAAFPDAATPLRIGVAGDDALESELSLLAKLRGAPQRAVISQNVRPGGPALRTLHVLFVSRSERANLSRYLEAVSGAPVLVLTDFEGAIDEGSMINFVMVQRRLRFDIAPAAAESAGLRISSHLLSVARLVRKGDAVR